MFQIRTLLCLVLAASVPVLAVEVPPFEGVARGYPVMRDAAGKKLADGDFIQWLQGDRLHVKIVYAFGRGHRIEEQTVFRQRPQLTQELWTWREDRNGRIERRFEMNFASATATAEKRDKDNKVERWSEKIDVEPGRTFAGFGFTMAIKGLRPRLLKGETIELQAVGFTPKPRRVDVAISHGGLDSLRMADRTLRADRFIIHPKLPWIADLIMDVPDVHIWLSPPPVGFVRWEGPAAEPKDAVVRVDVLPGGSSGPATRVSAPVSPRKETN
jgi:hypothetical protein